MRLACVYVPQLALQAALRRAPEARESPSGLLTSGTLGGSPRPPPTDSARRSRAPSRRIAELNAEARGAGVRPGMTAAQASATCPGLRLFTATVADAEAGAAALADVGYAFAPRVERDGERIYFAADDLTRLYPQGDQAIAQAVQAHAARLGFGARVAIASTKGSARAATRAHELAVVPAERNSAREFLAPLPVHFLTDDAELCAAFRRWGTRTAGAVAALPTNAVALRLGPAGAAVARLARGEDEEPFLPQLPPDALEEAVELDYPVYELEPLAFVLRGLCDRALERLAGRSLACAGLTLRLTLDPRGLDVREVPVAAPTREAKILVELARLDLARRPPEAAVVGVHLIALPARVRATQLDILRPSGPAPNRLAATLARLAALVGPENVGTPAAVDSWREEAIGVKAYPTGGSSNGSSGGSSATAQPVEEPGLCLRHRRPPEEIEVLMDRDGPAALRGAETTARILVAAGPYRLSGEWWRDAAEGGSWARDYWDVHASDGAVYRLHRDGRSGRFYLDGYYD
ncbi:MAG TPA: DNA polymerase Y family protein [Polyangia bacterium]|nr:DNA polymerase Y family protein [Polyangia bacterium]